MIPWSINKLVTMNNCHLSLLGEKMIRCGCAADFSFCMIVTSTGAPSFGVFIPMRIKRFIGEYV